MTSPKAPPGLAGTLCSFVLAPLIWNPLNDIAEWLRQVFQFAYQAHETYPDRISSPLIYFIQKLFDPVFVWQLIAHMRLNFLATVKWMGLNALHLPQAWLVSILPTLVAGAVLYFFARIAFANFPAWRQYRRRWVISMAVLGALSGLLTWGAAAATIPSNVLASPTAFYGYFLNQLPPFWQFFSVTSATGALLGGVIGGLSGRGEIHPEPQGATTSSS
jgi:hypothetical protein